MLPGNAAKYGAMPNGSAGSTGTPRGSAASTATRSAKIASVPSDRYPCCSVEPVGSTTRSSRCRYCSICIQLASNTRTTNLTALTPTETECPDPNAAPAPARIAHRAICGHTLNSGMPTVVVRGRTPWTCGPPDPLKELAKGWRRRGGQREHAGTQQADDLRRVGGGELVGFDEVPGDNDAEGDRADDRGPQARVVGRDGLRDLRLIAGYGRAGVGGGLGTGQHRAQQSQRRRRLARQPLGEIGEDLLGRLPGRSADPGGGDGVDHSPEQLLLGFEIVHDQARVDVGGRGHGPDRGPLVPGGEKDLGRGVEDARFGAAALLGARTGPRSVHQFILRALTRP